MGGRNRQRDTGWAGGCWDGSSTAGWLPNPRHISEVLEASWAWQTWPYPHLSSCAGRARHPWPKRSEGPEGRAGTARPGPAMSCGKRQSRSPNPGLCHLLTAFPLSSAHMQVPEAALALPWGAYPASATTAVTPIMGGPLALVLTPQWAQLGGSAPSIQREDRPGQSVCWDHYPVFTQLPWPYRRVGLSCPLWLSVPSRSRLFLAWVAPCCPLVSPSDPPFPDPHGLLLSCSVTTAPMAHPTQCLK